MGKILWAKLDTRGIILLPFQWDQREAETWGGVSVRKAGCERDTGSGMEGAPSEVGA